ncbi:MAG: CinA family protein [Thermoguttaceae bacterium]
MHAEIIAIGDEITSGRLLDTNTQWLSQRLEEMGIRVLYHSTVADELEPCAEVFRRGRKPTVGITASKTTIILRIAAEGATEEACYAAMEPTIATIRECLGTLVFGQDDEELQDAVVRLLRQQKKTLATVEWGTAGMVAGWLDGVPEANGYYLGGLVTPVDATLQNVLGIEADLLAKHASAGREMVVAMAAGCRRRFHSDYGLAVGRFPEFNASSREPKRVFIALADVDGVQVESFPFTGDPALLKIYSAKRALDLARLVMLGE